MKNIQGVQTVEVSLSKGEAVITFVPGNTVRYEQLLEAIDKNGFVAKGTNLTAQGTVVATGSSFELQITGSNERMKLEPANAVTLGTFVGKKVVVTGTVPELPKGHSAIVIREAMVKEK